MYIFKKDCNNGNSKNNTNKEKTAGFSVLKKQKKYT
jgi:hypothetical protein